MNQQHWQRRITHAVKCAADGNSDPLEKLAQQLADMDVATESLIAHGYGDDSDSLLACVDVVITGKEQTA